MLGVLHVRRLYDDKMIEEAGEKGVELEFPPDAKARFLRLLPPRSVSRVWGSLTSMFDGFHKETIQMMKPGKVIPLQRHTMKDVRYCKWETKGHFYVKSGYLLELGCFDFPESQSAHSSEAWWKIIWNLRIPQKVHIFFWRASKELLPTYLNMFRRHIHDISCCSFCGNPNATTSHCILVCP